MLPFSWFEITPLAGSIVFDQDSAGNLSSRIDDSSYARARNSNLGAYLRTLPIGRPSCADSVRLW